MPRSFRRSRDAVRRNPEPFIGGAPAVRVVPRRSSGHTLPARSRAWRPRAAGSCRHVAALPTILATRLLPAARRATPGAIPPRLSVHRSSICSGATRMPDIERTMPLMTNFGEGASLAGPGPSRLRRPEPASAVSSHAGDGPSRFRPPGGETAPLLDRVDQSLPCR